MDMVYADSLNPVSDDGFRFTGDTTRASVVPTFLRSIEVVEHLPCDVMISVHPDFTNVDGKLAARAQGAATRAAVTVKSGSEAPGAKMATCIVPDGELLRADRSALRLGISVIWLRRTVSGISIPVCDEAVTKVLPCRGALTARRRR